MGTRLFVSLSSDLLFLWKFIFMSETTFEITVGKKITEEKIIPVSATKISIRLGNSKITGLTAYFKDIAGNVTNERVHPNTPIKTGKYRFVWLEYINTDENYELPFIFS